ncbi:Cupin domain-containing protein [Bryocella elongata]|uniref:Cupin domain-containing protein n=1 Tax=Bryocella elongata TaxID=863522 RepID=A0A1H6C8C8_9BACT|nr:cupin domain-containing protein [Bryocella elongata]SEG69211.1 Cupin domain-containing protein [Bryocella elongata]
MNATETGNVNSIVRIHDEPTFAVVGTLLQFISTPEQSRANLSVMRGWVPAKTVIPLHSHADPEVFYVTEGSMEVFQDDARSAKWQVATAGDVVTIAGGVKHALRNSGSLDVATVLVSQEQLYRFFRELAEPLDPGGSPPAPTPEVMQKLFDVASRYHYWIGSPSDNAAIGIILG